MKLPPVWGSKSTTPVKAKTSGPRPATPVHTPAGLGPALTRRGLVPATHTGSRERGGGLRQTLERQQLQWARLTVGRKLVVAQQSTRFASNGATGAKKVIHQVRQGETLDKIATTYNTSVDAILSWNESEDLTVIHPGDRITIFLGNTN